MRKKTKEIKIGSVVVGGNNPIAIQSMTNTDTKDVEATVNQIHALTKAGVDIVRVTVPDAESVDCFAKIKESITIPIVADIHFDYKLAIAAIDAGADKIRINPGNIGSLERVSQVIERAREGDIPIRIGLNKGSYHGDIVDKMVEYIAYFESKKFSNIVLSLKSSNVRETIDLNREISKRTEYPLHVGVTEAGTIKSGIVKSSIGIGTLLGEGIGDTIRVSLTADPVEEVYAAKRILSSLSLIDDVDLVSCPTCGRTKIDLISMAERVEEFLIKNNIKKKIAVMGCVVNGPGEAKDADFGIAGGDGEGIIFAKGELLKKVPESELLAELFTLLQR